jgi:DNA-binding NarL/FixJ family response regulator
MEPRRILIAGDMLFAETLAGLLSKNSKIQVVGIAHDVETARKLLNMQCPDALIYASQTDEGDEALSRFLYDNPDLSIVCTDPNRNSIRIIISRQISVHSSGDLLAAIITLPKRS